MSYPEQTFATLGELVGYMNTKWITNGQGKITGVVGNNVVNSLAEFIKKSPLNWNRVQVLSDAVDVSVTYPTNAFITNTPTSLAWNDNIYNEFVFVNMTGNPIPLAGGYVFYDNNGIPQSSIPANSTVGIMKATNDLWIQVNSGSGGSTPVTPGAAWIYVNSGDFDTDNTYHNTYLDGKSYIIYWNEINRFLYSNGQEPGPPPVVDYQQVSGGGFKILADGFNPQAFSYHMYVMVNGAAGSGGGGSAVGNDRIYSESLFEANGVDLVDPTLQGIRYRVLLNGFTTPLRDTSMTSPQWQPLAGGGVHLLIPGFNMHSDPTNFIYVESY